MSTTTTGSRVVPQEDLWRDDWRWLIRVLALVVVFALVTLARSRLIDIPFRDPHGKLFRAKLPNTAEMLLAFVIVDILVRWVRNMSSGATLWHTIRNRWTPHRIVLIALGLVAYFVVYLCYRNLKSWDVLLAPKDAMLLRWDRWLLFGHSPAVLLHDLLGQDVAAHVLTAIYETFSWVVVLRAGGRAGVHAHRPSAYVFVTAAMWAWIIGVGSYYLIPSLGPFDAAPQEFSGLTRTSIQSTQATYLQQRAHLLAHPHASDAFAQISAFASLHCALTCLIWLMARYYGLRRLSWLAWPSSWSAPCWRRSTSAGTSRSTTWPGWRSRGCRSSSGN